MQATINHKEGTYKVDLSKPNDISLPLSSSEKNVNAWYLGSPKISPVINDNFIGSVASGSSVNFNNIVFNPHAHGTHTECVGHITKEFFSVNELLKTHFFFAQVISVTPKELENGDAIISKTLIENQIGGNANTIEALVIRTLPNDEGKKSRQYSNTNPPYLTEESAVYLKEIGVKHLLIDLPSVDKEKDNGELLAHKAFWNFNGDYRLDATITELIYVDEKIVDGLYFLNLQIAPFQNDATPSKPILYKII